MLDGELVRSELLDPDPGAASVAGPLLEAMALDRQPHRDLMALYQGWMDCLTAAEAARLTGNFRPPHGPTAPRPHGPTAAAAQREALRACQRLEQEAARLRSQAAKERQTAKQVDRNLELQRLDARLRAVRAQL